MTKASRLNGAGALAALTFTASLLLHTTAQAGPVTTTWVGGNDGLWGTSSNWDNGMPDQSPADGNEYTAIIDNGDDVFVNRAITDIDVLKLGQTTATNLFINPSKTLVLNGVTSAFGGRRGDASIIGSGSVVDIDASETLVNLAGSTLNNAGTIDALGGTVRNVGELNNSGTLNNDGTVRNLGRLYTTGTLNNNGTLNTSFRLDFSSTGTLSGNGTTTNNDEMWFLGSSQMLGGTVANDGLLYLFNSSQMLGGTVTNDGLLGLNDSSSISGGTVTNNDDMFLRNSSSISGGTVTNYGELELTDSSEISGDAEVTNDVLGKMYLSGDSQISGGTLINNGTIENAGAVNLNANSTFNNTGGTLNNNTGGEINVNRTLTFGDATTGTINLNNGGTLNINNTTVTNQLGNSLNNSGTLKNDGTLINNGLLNLDSNATLSGNGTVTNNGGLDLYDSSQISGGTVTTNYVSFIRLNDSSEISGGTVTNGDNATLSLYDSSLISGGTVTNDAFGTLSLNDSSQISGGTVTNFGELDLTDSSQISGGTVTNFGVLDLRDNSEISGGMVTNNGAIVRTGTGTSIIAGTLINDGLVKGNSGNSFVGFGDGLILTGDVSGSGSYQGEIAFNGTSENRSTFRPGNSAALIDAETLIFGEYNDLFMEIGGLDRGTEYDAFNVSAALTFGGLLDVSFIDGFLPSGPSMFELFNFSSASGTFANIILPTLDSLWLWDTDSLYTDGIISIVAAAVNTGVPGPGAIFILVFGLAGFGVMRRRAK